MAFNNYTIFDLYEIILANGRKIPAKFSKASLIDIIEEADMVIPYKGSKDEIDWYLSRLWDRYIICIAFDNEEFYIQEEDIIMTEDHNRYLIDKMYFKDDDEENEDNLIIVLKHIDTEEQISASGQDLINLLGDENITYEYSSYADYRFGSR
jgi:hypothetical protein